jgi:hypothetical protein
MNASRGIHHVLNLFEPSATQKEQEQSQGVDR